MRIRTVRGAARTSPRRPRVPTSDLTGSWLRIITRAGLLAVGAIFASCGSDPAGPDPDGIDPVEPADVSGYVQGLPSWSTFAEPKTPADSAVGPTGDPDIFTQGATQYSCTTTPYSLTQNPDRLVVFNPDSEILWLGGLLQGKGHLQGLGSLAELPIRQRAPLTVFIDLLSQNVTRTVESPDPASVQSAVGELVEQATLSGHKAGSNYFFDKKETHSLEQGSLSLGISARYMGTTVKSQLDFEQSRERNVLTAYFVQRMYTASVVLPQTPGALFSDELTDEILDEQVRLGRVGPENPPTFVSNIVYGRMLMVTMTSTHTYEEMRAALDASNDAIGSGSIDTTHRQVLVDSEIQVVAVGGDEQGLVTLIEEGRLGEYLDADLELSQARPLSYTVRNLADNSIATVSETTKYDLRECATSPAPPTGASYKLTLDKLTLISNGCDGGFTPSPEVYYSFSLTTSAGTEGIVSRSSSAAVTMKESTSHTLPFNERTVNLYSGGSSMRITGNAWDYDSNSNDERIGSWDLSYAYGLSNGQRYFTRSENGCSIRLYLTITKTGDLYD